MADLKSSTGPIEFDGNCIASGLPGRTQQIFFSPTAEENFVLSQAAFDVDFNNSAWSSTSAEMDDDSHQPENPRR